MKNTNDYSVLFSEIINGYSICILDNKNIYIKHPSYIDIGNNQYRYNIFLDKAKRNSFPLKEIREKEIIKDGSWKESDEIEIFQLEKIIQDLRINYSKSFLHSQRLKLKDLIDQNLENLNRLKIKKNYFIGPTAEQWAINKMNDYRIFSSLFYDANFKSQVVDENDIVSDDDYNKYYDIYHQYIDKIDIDVIKKISISNLFMNIFSLSENNAESFYGKPVVQLSEYQVGLFNYGKYFKNILSSRSDIPKEIMGDPNELMNWIELRTNAEESKVFSEESEGSISLVGATKDDYIKLGINPGASVNKLSQELKKRGGTLRGEDLMRMEGQ